MFYNKGGVLDRTNYEKFAIDVPNKETMLQRFANYILKDKDNPVKAMTCGEFTKTVNSGKLIIPKETQDKLLNGFVESLKAPTTAKENVNNVKVQQESNDRKQEEKPEIPVLNNGAVVKPKKMK